jgi:hypothetical protein
VTKKKEIRIPISESGEMQRYSYSNERFIDNCEWDDKLKYRGYARGRSAAYFIFKSELNEKKYYMFMKDLDDSIGRMALGILEGRFTYCKRGQNFGIRMIP